MAIQKKHASFLLLQMVLVLLVLDTANAQGLKVGYYHKTCPSAETIIKETTHNYISQAPTLAASLLRIFFHDCIVRGCDGSILLNSTRNNQAEKDATPNQSLRGFQVIDATKIKLEKKCPGVVSCADILAIVARDAIAMIKGPYWQVMTGRRDGRVSTTSDALNNLPSPSANISELKALFGAKGLSVKDLAVLSGGHTIGVARCSTFTNRLYNFTGRGDTDPTMEPNYIIELKRKCKLGDSTTLVEMDPRSLKDFDTDYYTLVSKRRGLFQSDAALLNDDQTRAYVLQAKSSGSTFFRDFSESMAKLGQIGVLTGNLGEIRKQCAFIN